MFRDALDLAAARLTAAGLSDGRREALALWAGLRRISPGAVLLETDGEVSAERLAEFAGMVDRRAAGEPLAYVTGWIGFRHLDLRTDRRALIPRPETEGLVERVLAETPGGRVLDVGTGTGCIALSLADEGRYALVAAVDRSADALALARSNAVVTGLEVAYFQGDLTAAFGAASFDVLVSNPPYLTEAEYEALDPSVRAWEPALALPSGPDGLDATAALLDDGRRVLAPGGLLALEVDVARAHAVAALARELGWQAVTVTVDLFDRARFVTARWRIHG